MQLRNIQQVQFETDSKIVADAILHQHGGFSEFCLLIRHISNLLLSNANFSVKFIKRQANMVAHTLARAFLGLIVVPLRHYHFVLLNYYLMK
jgi:hypothetical protein